jgi:hypothetical protein
MNKRFIIEKLYYDLNEIFITDRKEEQSCYIIWQ